MDSTVIKDNDTYIYFLYSEQQLKERETIERSMSRVFTPGKVIVNGRKLLYTELSKNPTNRYPDCKIVAEGFKSKMIYTKISSK